MKITSIASAVVILVPLALGSCKGKEATGTDAALAGKLEACEASLSDAAKIRSQLETELASRGEEDGSEVVVNINGAGGILSITGGKGPNASAKRSGETKVVGNAKDEELYKKFVASVKKARNPMTQCYRRALKNDSSLQARTVTVKFKVSYATSGRVTRAGSTPKLNNAFSSCISGVAKKWALPAMPKAASFVAPLTLTPES